MGVNVPLDFLADVYKVGEMLARTVQEFGPLGTALGREKHSETPQRVK